MKYKIKSMKLKKQPTKTVGDFNDRLLKTTGGAIGVATNQYDGYSDVFIEFFPDDESLPSLPLVTITHDINDESCVCNADRIRVYVDDGTGNYTKYCDEWSIKNLIEYAEGDLV